MFLIRDYRDTFPLNKEYMVVRSFFRTIDAGGVFIGPRDRESVYSKELDPVPELLPQANELKTGSNVVARIGSNEYLLIYHCVDRYGVYYTYAAVFSRDGELLSATAGALAAALGYITLFTKTVARHGKYVFKPGEEGILAPAR